MRPYGVMVACAVMMQVALVRAEEPASVAEVPILSSQSSDEDRLAAETLQQQHNLKLIMTGTEGIYISGARVTISDTENHLMVQHVVCTPVFLARLLAGTYYLDVTADDFTTTQNVVVDAEGIRTYFINFPMYGGTGKPHYHPQPPKTWFDQILDALGFVESDSDAQCS